MNRIEFDSEVVVPDSNNPHNYMLDTSAINKIAGAISDLEVLTRSKEFGYRYYLASMQEYELNGAGAKTYNENGISSSWYNPPKGLDDKIPLFWEILDHLSMQRVSSVASFMLNHTILDGTYRELEDQDKKGELIQSILHLIDKKPALKRKKPFSYHYDAMIAEAAMYHNCFLVTNDDEMFDEVNKLFPGRAIKYHDFVDGLIQGLA